MSFEDRYIEAVRLLGGDDAAKLALNHLANEQRNKYTRLYKQLNPEKKKAYRLHDAMKVMRDNHFVFFGPGDIPDLAPLFTDLERPYVSKSSRLVLLSILHALEVAQ